MWRHRRGTWCGGVLETREIRRAMKRRVMLAWGWERARHPAAAWAPRWGLQEGVAEDDGGLIVKAFYTLLKGLDFILRAITHAIDSFKQENDMGVLMWALLFFFLFAGEDGLETIILKVGGEAGWEIVITSQAKNEDSNDNGGIALILVEKSSKRINVN